ncbi:MAG: DUF2612 domain-containing protein [Elusimicrobia bacterium]|nr:DUF2612 domain-containing protein [Elusimicrobiota bacterium]
MTDAELVATYVKLLPIQWSGPATPKAQDTIDLLATTAIASQIVGQVLDGFALTSIYGQAVAVGDQLDILGQFVGAQRVLPTYDPTLTYFGQQDTTGSYNPLTGGYGDAVAATPPTDYWLSTNQVEGSGYTLSDAQMIQLIQYLAAVNHADYTVEVIDAILYEFFGTYVTVEETAPMQLTYTQSSSDPGTLFGIVNHIGAFPHPAGVDIVVVPG